jgi:uncharacterized protein YacL
MQIQRWSKKLTPKIHNVESANFFFVILSINGSTSMEKFLKQLLDFYHIWPLAQWISSLVGLVVLYLITGYYYNKWLSDKGGWLDMKTRVWLIVFDISLNLVVGIYYMNHRETILGAIMVRCPVAISPGIFAAELCCFYFYCRYLRHEWEFRKPKKQN